MARVDAARATEKWVRNIGQATQDISAGVDRVTRAPGLAAAEKFQKWITGVQENAQKWRTNVSRVSLEEWQSAMKNVGINRIAQGAQAKQAKMEKFMAEFLPHLDRGVAQIKAMPDTTFEDRIARATAMMRHNHTFKRSGTA